MSTFDLIVNTLDRVLPIAFLHSLISFIRYKCAFNILYKGPRPQRGGNCYIFWCGRSCSDFILLVRFNYTLSILDPCFTLALSFIQKLSWTRGIYTPLHLRECQGRKEDTILKRTWMHEWYAKLIFEVLKVIRASVVNVNIQETPLTRMHEWG